MVLVKNGFLILASGNRILKRVWDGRKIGTVGIEVKLHPTVILNLFQNLLPLKTVITVFSYHQPHAINREAVELSI